MFKTVDPSSQKLLPIAKTNRLMVVGEIIAVYSESHNYYYYYLMRIESRSTHARFL
jgi:effector-binding domain-containing protein